MQASPFLLDTSRHPRMGFEPRPAPSARPDVNTFVSNMADAVQEARAAIDKAKQRQAMYYNRRRRPAPVFAPGDKVWLDATDIRQARPAKKLSDRYLGPFEVEAAVGTAAYRLKLPPSMSRLHPVFPVVKLERAEADPVAGREAPPPPDPVLVDGVQQYVVEEIVDYRVRYRRPQFLVRWEGYDELTWEPAKDLELDAPERVEDFYRLHPNVPRPNTISVIKASAMDISHHWDRRPSGRRALEGG